jgi:hypothetical protein
VRSGVVIASVGGLEGRVVTAGAGPQWWWVACVGVLMGPEGGFPFGVEGGLGPMGLAADYVLGIVAAAAAAAVVPIAGGLACAPLQQLAPPPLPVLHASGVL